MYRWGTEFQRGKGQSAQGHMLGSGLAGDLTSDLIEITWPDFLLEAANMQRGSWKNLPQGSL